MGWFSDDSDQAQAYEKVNNDKAELSYRDIGDAAAYQAMKAYESHCVVHGTPDSHAKAKEILAAISGRFVDRIVETQGFDIDDSEKAKHVVYQQLAEESLQDY